MPGGIAGLVERLKTNPDVIGLVRYGRRVVGDESQGGDFDLFAFVRCKDPDLESIHFYWDSVPVDLNLRTLDDLRREEPVLYIDVRLSEGEILYDPTGEIYALIEQSKSRWAKPDDPLPEAEIALCRFFQQHVLDKVDGRLKEDATFAEMLLSINICWLMHIYYKVRGMSFPGERGALNWLREHEPEIASRIDAFFATADIETKFQLSVQLTDLVLEPVGGPWRRGEVLGIGVDLDSENLHAKAEDAYSRLLGESLEGDGKEMR